MKPSEIFEVDQKDEMSITYTVKDFDRYTTDGRPIVRRQSMFSISAEISADSRSICRPSLDRYLG